eukprot:m51a1_g13543 hypothetical protein (200) ;mRNA; r:1318-1917
MSLVAACKREHVTVTDAITAALLMAMPSENVRVVQAVCMRDPKEPVQLNLDMTPTILPLADVKGLQLWDAARKCHTAMRTCLDNQCRSVCTKNLLRAYSSKCGTQRVPLKDRDLHTLFLSSMGDIDRRLNTPGGAAPSSCKWEDYAVCTGNPSTPWTTYMWASTIGGCLRLTSTEMDAPTDPQEIHDLIATTFKILKAL